MLIQFWVIHRWSLEWMLVNTAVTAMIAITFCTHTVTQWPFTFSFVLRHRSPVCPFGDLSCSEIIARLISSESEDFWCIQFGATELLNKLSCFWLQIDHIQKTTFRRPHSEDHIQKTTFRRPHSSGYIQSLNFRRPYRSISRWRTALRAYQTASCIDASDALIWGDGALRWRFEMSVRDDGADDKTAYSADLPFGKLKYSLWALESNVWTANKPQRSTVGTSNLEAIAPSIIMWVTQSLSLRPLLMTTMLDYSTKSFCQKRILRRLERFRPMPIWSA